MNAQTGIEPPTLAKLREPFAANLISKLPKPTKRQTDDVRADYKKGSRCKLCGSWHHPDVVHLDYVGHAALTDRLLDTDPEWSWEPVAFGSDGLPAFDRNGGLWIRLTVLGVTRLGYGDADGKSGGNAVKEAIGDALRNAAMRFGAALDLWHKGDLHAEDEGASDSGSGKDNSEARQASQPATDGQGGMPDAEHTRLVQLIEATKTVVKPMLEYYGVANLRQLGKDDYLDAVNRLTDRLAEMSKQETNDKSRGQFADLDDEITF